MPYEAPVIQLFDKRINILDLLLCQYYCFKKTYIDIDFLKDFLYTSGDIPFIFKNWELKFAIVLKPVS
jgi:hypothetical protein